MLLLALLASLVSAETRQFDMHLYAPFLEPGVGAGAPGPEVWRGPDENGRFALTIWHKKAVVSGGAVDMGDFNVWRHRHGYVRDPQGGYHWSTLGDHREPLDAALGAAYDEHLKAVFEHWALRAAGQPASAPPADTARLNKKAALRYDRAGLVGVSEGEFHIRLWGVPARVRFALRRKEATHMDPWIVTLARPLDVSWDKAEWRRRHDVPGPLPAAARERLMERCFQYWAAAAAHIVIGDLDGKLKQALGSAAAPAAEPPALRALRQAEERWPSE